MTAERRTRSCMSNIRYGTRRIKEFGGITSDGQGAQGVARARARACHMLEWEDSVDPAEAARFHVRPEHPCCGGFVVWRALVLRLACPRRAIWVRVACCHGLFANIVGTIDGGSTLSSLDGLRCLVREGVGPRYVL